MRFSLHGESIEEEAALRRLAERVGAEFEEYGALKEEKPLHHEQWLPQRIGRLGFAEHDTRRLDEGPPSETVVGTQDPLPGLETPPCR